MARTISSIAESKQTLGALEKESLFIIRLAEPVSPVNAQNGAKRSSDASADTSSNPTPASFAADLTHYKVLKISLDKFKANIVL